MLAAQLQERSLTTIEGLAPSGAGELHPVQEAFIDHGAVQCGFCTPGMVLAAVDLLGRTRDPGRDEIRRALSGNLCRCTGYVKIVDAVEAAARKIKPGSVHHGVDEGVSVAAPGDPIAAEGGETP
jgi:carbon-monoxide dehydrogenase small subunit